MIEFTLTEFLRQKYQAMAMHEEINETNDYNFPSYFCTNSKHGGMAMYMDGFHFSLRSASSDSGTQLHCLNLFVPSWTLSTKSRFVLATILVTALGISIEGLSTYKIKLANECPSSSSSSDKSHRWGRFARKIIILRMTFLNFLQALIR